MLLRKGLLGRPKSQQLNVLGKSKSTKLKAVKIGDKDISMQQAKLSTKLKGNFKKVK